jgi:Concanavalin A-like lectin/glucanases superfamily
MAVVSDSFNRANGAIGISDSGHTWIAQTGSWIISANRAASSSAAGSQATVAIDSGLTSCSLSVDATFQAASDSGVIFAGINASNHLLLTTENPALRLWKVDAGAYTSLWGPTGVTNYGNSTKQIRVEWDAAAGTIGIWFGGVLQTTVTLSAGDRAKYASATRQGLRENGTTTLFDNYSVSAPGVLVSIAAPTATATTSSPSPSVGIGGVLAPSMPASAQALAPAVFTYLPTTVVVPMAAASSATAPVPTLNVIVYEAEAPPARGSAQMLAPVRFGPVPPSIYKQMVDRVSPPPTVVYHFDDDTGAPLILGDTGHSRVFDGIDDWNNVAIPPRIGHTTFILWFQEGESPGAAPGLFSDQNQTWWLQISGTLLTFANVATTNIARDGQRHMVMVTLEDRSDDFPPHGPLVKLFLDGALAATGQGGDLPLQPDFSHAIIGARWGGLFPNEAPAAFFKGQIDELAVWLTPAVDVNPLQDEWAKELWWQGTGAGGPPTSIEVPTARVVTSTPVPTIAVRPVIDSWQIHDDFSGDELDPELWTVGYQPQFLQAEGPNGPAPPVPLDEVPFLIDGKMIVRTGTMLTSRDWFTFGEWVARVSMEPVSWDSKVTIAIGLFATFPQDGDFCGYSFPYTPGCPVVGMPYTKEYENQFAWWSYDLNGRRYVTRAWGVYSPLYDDSSSIEITPYDPAQALHSNAVITSPISREAQFIAHYDSGDVKFGYPSTGFMPYWPSEGPYDARYETRALRLAIQVSGPPGESITITGINLTKPATKFVIPTAHLQANVEAILDHTFPRPYAGPQLPRSIKVPVMRTTARFIAPPPSVRIAGETMRAIADFRFPDWAGDALPTWVYPGPMSAFGGSLSPILVGEPQDVVIDAPVAAGTGRAFPPETSGVVGKAFGITKFTIRKVPVEITFRSISVTISMRELVTA